MNFPLTHLEVRSARGHANLDANGTFTLILIFTMHTMCQGAISFTRQATASFDHPVGTIVNTRRLTLAFLSDNNMPTLLICLAFLAVSTMAYDFGLQ